MNLQNDKELFSIGLKNNFVLYKSNIKLYLKHNQNDNSYNYQGIEKALCGKTIEKFTPKRIVVIQMK